MVSSGRFWQVASRYPLSLQPACWISSGTAMGRTRKKIAPRVECPVSSTILCPRSMARAGAIRTCSGLSAKWLTSPRRRPHRGRPPRPPRSRRASPCRRPAVHHRHTWRSWRPSWGKPRCSRGSPRCRGPRC